MVPALQSLHEPLPSQVPCVPHDDAGMSAHSCLTSSSSWFWQEFETHFLHIPQSLSWQQAPWGTHRPPHSLYPLRQAEVEQAFPWQAKFPLQSLSAQHPAVGIHALPQGLVVLLQLANMTAPRCRSGLVGRPARGSRRRCNRRRWRCRSQSKASECLPGTL